MGSNNEVTKFYSDEDLIAEAVYAAGTGRFISWREGYDYADYDLEDNELSIDIVKDYDDAVTISDIGWDFGFDSGVEYDLVISSGSSITITDTEEDEDWPVYKYVVSADASVDGVEADLFLEAYLKLDYDGGYYCHCLTSSDGKGYRPVLKINGVSASLAESYIAEIIDNTFPMESTVRFYFSI